MQLFSWLHDLIAGCSPVHRRHARFFPQLEIFEDRCLPSTLTVTSPKDHGPGTLRAEIAAAQTNDVIVFSPKLDGKTITLTSGELYLTKNLTIHGPSASQLTISGDNRSRVFEVADNTNVALSGLTISEGIGKTSVYASSGSPLNGCGGGILNEGTLTVSDCTIFANWASDGGGIYNSDGATLMVSGCTVSSNHADFDGGGIWNGGTATVTSSTVSGNDVGGSMPSTVGTYVGAGIVNYGTLTISNTTFSGNDPDNVYGTYIDGGGNTVS